MYNKPRPHRPERRHTSATGVNLSSQEDSNLARLTSSPSIRPPIHSNTDSQILESHETGTPDIEQQAIAPTHTTPSATTSAPEQFDTEPTNGKKRGFIAGRIFKLRNRQHHPATESAYRKSILSNLKTILFSSWVNVLLVFVPIVLPIPDFESSAETNLGRELRHMRRRSMLPLCLA